VIQAALQAGYRWEPESPGCLPSLTNMPPGAQFCIYCGQYVDLVHYAYNSGRCLACFNAQQLEKKHARAQEARHGH
jgi:hypothetical protein